MKSTSLPTFTIPKKKKKRDEVEPEKEIPAPPRGVWSARQINLQSGNEKAEILSKFEENFHEKDNWKHFLPLEMRLYENDYLKWKFNEAKRYLRSSGIPDTETYGFREIYSAAEENRIAKNGLPVKSSHIGDIGDPNYGVYVYQHPDTVTSSMHFYDNVPMSIMIFKTLRGKPYQAGLGSGELEPQTGRISHVAVPTDQERSCARRRLAHRLSAVYHYEFKSDGFSTRKVPATVLPIALVRFKVNTNIKYLKDPLATISAIYPVFSTFPATTAPIDFKVPNFDSFRIMINTPLRIGEPPNGLFDLDFQFSANPFYPARKIANFHELLLLQKSKHGQLLHSTEIPVADKYATYNILQPDLPQVRTKFREMLDKMRISGVFLFALDWDQTRHFLFPSGEISTAFGLPVLEDALHCISISPTVFSLRDLPIPTLTELENTLQLRSGHESHKGTEFKDDPDFKQNFEDMVNKMKVERISCRTSSSSSDFADLIGERFDGEDIERRNKIVILPRPEKGILYKPPLNSAGIPIIKTGKRRPHIKVQWEADVVDNDNKAKNTAMLEKQKNERRPLTNEEKEKMKAGNDAFKNAFASSMARTVENVNKRPENAFGVPIQIPSDDSPSKSPTETISIPQPVPPPSLPRNIPIEQISFSTPASGNFSLIKTLPLPRRPTPSTSFPSTPMYEEPEVEDVPVIVLSEDEEDKMMTIDDEDREMEKDEKMEEEPEIVEEEVQPRVETAPEENEILKLCFSSSAVKEDTATSPVSSIFSVLKLDLSKEALEILSTTGKDNVAKDVDLRAAQDNGAAPAPFQLRKAPAAPTIVKPVDKSIFGQDDEEEERNKESEKKKEDGSRKKNHESGGDRDYRTKEHSSRHRDSHQHRHRDRDDRRGDRDERRSDRDHRRTKDRDDRVHSTRESSKEVEGNNKEELKTPSNNNGLNKKTKLENNLQEILRQRGKDIDSRLVGNKVPNIIQNSSAPGPSNFFNKLGIDSGILHAVSSANTNNFEHFDSPASPPPDAVVRSNFEAPLIAYDSPAEMEEIQEIEEPDDLQTNMPSTILGPIVVPVEGAAGWETVRENKPANVEKPPEKPVVASKKKPIDHDFIKATGIKDADASWLNAIQRSKKNKEKKSEEEEEGEYISDPEDDEIQVIEEIEEPNNVETAKSPPPVKEIPQEPVQKPMDRDDRVIPQNVQIPKIPTTSARRSRFDITAPPQPQIPSLINMPINPNPRSRFNQPPAPQHPMIINGPTTAFQGPPQFFNRGPVIPGPAGLKAPLLPGRPGGVPLPLGGGPPPLPGPPAASRFGRGAGGSRFQYRGGIQQGFGNRQPNGMAQPSIVVIIDSMMFNRAVMDSELLQNLCETLRRLLMEGKNTKLFVHKHVFDSMMASKIEIQNLYRAILLRHQGTLVFVMDEHACDRNMPRNSINAVNCLTTMKQKYPHHDVIYLSNLSPEAELGRELTATGVRILKLDYLMQHLSRQ